MALLAVSGLGTGYLASSHGGKGGIGAANAATIPAPFDLLAMFSGRSPGARDPGALTQTKVRERVAANVRSRPPGAAGAPGAGVPEERVLTSLRERPLTTGEPGAGFDNLPFSAVDGPLVSATNPSPLGGTPPGSLVAPPLAVPPTTTTPPVAAVPEPATWMMMMIGLFGLGSALRRRERRVVLADR
ncbi:MAG: PEP-CTERM sorting domain-containing protein [Sphingomonas bacterium]